MTKNDDTKHIMKDSIHPNDSKGQSQTSRLIRVYNGIKDMTVGKKLGSLQSPKLKVPSTTAEKPTPPKGK